MLQEVSEQETKSEETGGPTHSGDGNQVEFSKAAGLAEKTLKLANDHLCAPYPKVYEVLYTYVSGHNTRLNSMVDEVLSENKEANKTELEAIHREVLDPVSKFQDVLLDTGQKLDGELTDITALTEKYISTNDNYQSTLNRSVESLKTSDSTQDLSEKILELIQENERMRDQTMELTESLEKSKEQIDDLKMCLSAAIDESMKDQLTGLGNRRWLERNFRIILENAGAGVERYCIVLLDIDRFKKINDTFGHLVGDKVLKYFGRIIQNNVRNDDICARFGGEEFCIILKKANIRQAEEVMENLRQQLEKSNLVLANSKTEIGTVTASFGITSLKTDDTLEGVLERVDGLLYEAKETGRNRIVCG